MCVLIAIYFWYTQKKINNVESDYNTLEGKHEQMYIEFEQLREHARKVEQKNDDLERSNRVVAATVTDLEAMLNQAYEKNEFLELEVEDKECLSVKHQRVLDELRGNFISNSCKPLKKFVYIMYLISYYRFETGNESQNSEHIRKPHT